MTRWTLLLAGAALILPQAAQAAKLYDVSGTSNPWNYVDGGLNTDYQFGNNDGTGPVVATFGDAGITPGGSWAVVFVSGATSAFDGAPPSAEGNGYVGSVFKDNDPGSSGNYFPSHYMSQLWNDDPNAGVFLSALTFVFTDANGQILGSGPDAFQVGYDADTNSYFNVVGKGASATPDGATQIQLGINDDIFGDNSGSLKICVGENFEACDALINAPVPEPATWAMMIAGFGLVGGAMRRRKMTTTVRFA